MEATVAVPVPPKVIAAPVPAKAPTKRRRGPNKNPTKGEWSDGIYKLSREQKDAKNERKKALRVKDKLAKMTEENKLLKAQLQKVLTEKEETVLFSSLNVLGEAAAKLDKPRRGRPPGKKKAAAEGAQAVETAVTVELQNTPKTQKTASGKKSATSSKPLS
jgi:hypothetical protein